MKKITFLITAFLFTGFLHATVFYVSPAGSGAKTGTSWDDAFDLSTASLEAGTAGDEFWVKAGEYQVNIAITNRTLYGGFNGTETELSQRNWAKNQTIIKGVNNATSTLVSMFINATIDGFIIQDNQNSTANGAGIHLRNRGIVRNCIIRNNSVGGANVGGGIFVDGLIEENISPTIENCLIVHNSAANNGGGIQVANGRALHIINSTVSNNKITKATGETGSGFGCGIGLPPTAIMVAENCIVFNNSKPDGEGNLVFSFGANFNANTNAGSTVRNCAYDAINPANGAQNGVNFTEENACINDLSTEKAPGFRNTASFAGAMATTDSKYQEILSADYRLLTNSICIDKGNNLYSTIDKDLNFNNRIANGTIDMGAYEALILINKGTQNDLVLEGEWNLETFNKLVTAPATITSINLTGTDISELPVIDGLNPNCLIYSSAGSVTESKVNYINGTTAITPIQLTDKKPVNCPVAITLPYGASYVRECYTDGGWETLVLPFACSDFTSKDMYVIEELDGKENNTLTFKNVSSMTANTGYILKHTSGASGTQTVTFIADEGSNLQTTPASSGLVGTFIAEDGTNKYFLDEKGEFFGIGNTGTTIPPFRAYYQPEDGNKAPSYSVIHDGSGTTDMKSDEYTKGTIYSKDGVVYIDSEKAQVITIYTLDGRKIYSEAINSGTTMIEGLLAGFYLINNTKVVVK